MLYPIAEIFSSIQGEGTWVGNPCVFIRFAGCNLNCEWCDTDHSPKYTSNENGIIAKIRDVCEDPKHIVLTGGEPTIHDLEPLLKEIREELYQSFIQIESNGELPGVLLHLHHKDLVDHITVSPKRATIECRSSINIADEIKVVLDGHTNPNEYQAMAGAYVQDHLAYRTAFIQPLSGDVKPALEFVMTHPEWRLGVQLHKLIGIR